MMVSIGGISTEILTQIGRKVTKATYKTTESFPYAKPMMAERYLSVFFYIRNILWEIPSMQIILLAYELSFGIPMSRLMT
jgi:hypothetical protein